MRTWLTTGTIFLLLVGILGSTSAQASTRTVYFDQSAVASSIYGFSTDQYAKCRIVISNPSSQMQDFTIKVYVTSTIGGSSTSGTTVSGSNDSTMFTGNPLSATIPNVSGNTSKTYDFLFGVFSAGSGPVDQQLNCHGSIVATDTTDANPGFAVANGMILTFSESSGAQTAGSTAGSTSFVGSAVYTQIPITINGGKPF